MKKLIAYTGALLDVPHDSYGKNYVGIRRRDSDGSLHDEGVQRSFAESIETPSSIVDGAVYFLERWSVATGAGKRSETRLLLVEPGQGTPSELIYDKIEIAIGELIDGGLRQRIKIDEHELDNYSLSQLKALSAHYKARADDERKSIEGDGILIEKERFKFFPLRY